MVSSTILIVNSIQPDLTSSKKSRTSNAYPVGILPYVNSEEVNNHWTHSLFIGSRQDRIVNYSSHKPGDLLA